MSERPTTVQKRILARMAEGDELVRHFDVWGGYWWTIGKEDRVGAKTMDALTLSGAVVRGKDERVFSGRQRAVYSVRPLPLSKEDGKE